MGEKFRLYISERVRKETLVDIEHKNFLGFGKGGKDQTGLYLLAVAFAAEPGCNPQRAKKTRYESFVMDKSVNEMPLAQLLCTYLGLQDSVAASVDMVKEENWREVINGWVDPLADRGFQKIASLMQRPIGLESANLLTAMDEMYNALSSNSKTGLPQFKKFSR